MVCWPGVACSLVTLREMKLIKGVVFNSHFVDNHSLPGSGWWQNAILGEEKPLLKIEASQGHSEGGIIKVQSGDTFKNINTGGSTIL